MTKTGNGKVAEALYRAGVAPWDIGECQPIIRRLAALGGVRGDVLDPGCGTGWHAIEYARAGCSVTAVDAAMTAIVQARRNARAASVAVNFKLGEVTTTLAAYEARFDTVVDCKLYDNLDSTEARHEYAQALHRATKPDARLLIYGFGPGHVNGVHNHLLEEPDIENVLPAAGFTITYRGSTTYELNSTGFKPICRSCPRTLPDGRIHIPVTEFHAVRH